MSQILSLGESIAKTGAPALAVKEQGRAQSPERNIHPHLCTRVRYLEIEHTALRPHQFLGTFLLVSHFGVCEGFFSKIYSLRAFHQPHSLGNHSFPLTACFVRSAITLSPCNHSCPLSAFFAPLTTTPFFLLVPSRQHFFPTPRSFCPSHTHCFLLFSLCALSTAVFSCSLLVSHSPQLLSALK